MIDDALCVLLYLCVMFVCSCAHAHMCNGLHYFTSVCPHAPDHVLRRSRRLGHPGPVVLFTGPAKGIPKRGSDHEIMLKVTLRWLERSLLRVPLLPFSFSGLVILLSFSDVHATIAVDTCV